MAEQREMLTVGNGGWVRYRTGERAGDLHRSDNDVFLRFAERDGSRLEPIELYWPAQLRLSSTALRDLPLGRIEAWVNEQGMAEMIRSTMRLPGIPMRTLATYFGTWFNEDALGPDQRNWVVDAYFSEHEKHPEFPRVEPQRSNPGRGQISFPSTPSGTAQGTIHTALDITATVTGTDQLEQTPPDPKLNVPTRKPFGDDFYRAVATAYSRLARDTRAPSPVIAEANGVPASTVRGWVKEARRRGFLPPGNAGRAG